MIVRGLDIVCVKRSISHSHLLATCAMIFASVYTRLNPIPPIDTTVVHFAWKGYALT